MINENRIVPVSAIDLLSLYGLILKQDSNNATLAKVDAVAIGEVDITSAATPLICSEPVKHLNIDNAVTSATIYFVAAYDYEGMSIEDVAITPTGTVSADGVTLYQAVLSSGTVTVTKVGF